MAKSKPKTSWQATYQDVTLWRPDVDDVLRTMTSGALDMWADADVTIETDETIFDDFNDLHAVCGRNPTVKVTVRAASRAGPYQWVELAVHPSGVVVIAAHGPKQMAWIFQDIVGIVARTGTTSTLAATMRVGWMLFALVGVASLVLDKWMHGYGAFLGGLLGVSAAFLPRSVVAPFHRTGIWLVPKHEMKNPWSEHARSVFALAVGAVITLAIQWLWNRFVGSSN